MPSSSIKQRNYIFYLRNKYKNKSNTPSKYSFIWDSSWEQIAERYIPFNFNEKSKTVDGYKSPEGRDISNHELDILASTYASCRKKDDDKTKCSKIAWSAVNKSK